MNYVVTIPTINCLFLVEDLPGESTLPLKGPIDWRIEEGGWVELVPNLSEWPNGTAAPQTTVCQSYVNLKRYKVFNRPEDVPHDEFQITGMNWGGFYSRRQWEQFAREGLAALLEFYEIPDTDSPGAMDEVMRSIRGVH